MKRPSPSSTSSKTPSKAKPKRLTSGRTAARTLSPQARAAANKATPPRKVSLPASSASKTPTSTVARRTPKTSSPKRCAGSPHLGSETKPAQTKQSQLVALLGSDPGASIAQMVALTGWQAHTVRGAISGALRKRLGLDVRACLEEGVRVYRIHRARGGMGS